MSRIVYLACPYTHPNPIVREERFRQATKAAAYLVRKRYVVYSPITMTHPIDLLLGKDVTLGSYFWVNFDEAFMEICREMHVLTLPEWSNSNGIQREIKYFTDRQRPIHFLSPAAVDANG